MAAYGLAVSVAEFGLNFWVGILVGILAAVVLALLLGAPTLRLRADYLAIVTIAAAEIIRIIARSVTYKDTLGGSDGLQNFNQGFRDINPFPEGDYQFGPIDFQNEDRMWVVTVGWVLVMLCCLFVFLLIRSPWGRVIKGIREDEDAVRSLGKNVFSYKMQALVIGGVLGCFGGFIFALDNASVQPDNYGTQLTFFAYTVLILGGAARVFGPVAGAVIFWLILAFTDSALNAAIREGVISESIIDNTQVGQVQLMLVGLLLMLLMIFRPQGIFGDKREIALDAR